MSKSRLLTLLILAVVTLLLNQPGSTSPLNDAGDNLQPKPQPTPLRDELFVEKTEIAEAVQARVIEASEDILAYLVYQTDIVGIRFSDDGTWALANLLPSDPETGEALPAEPGLVFSRWVDGDWVVTLPSDLEWLSLLLQAPDELLSDEHKAAWLERYESEQVNLPTQALSGYLLPWAGGATRFLSRSISHDVDIPSGSAHFAFDFYLSGQMWDIYAAKSATVWLWKDDVPTCLQPTCYQTQPVGNYIVLRDGSTNPVSYQLYLHLAQNSIPPELKVRDAPVMQGQFIGIADNTGQSSGHHLHFQVHTNPGSYWGTSVDIVFSDVDIFGGRPRTASEAAGGRSAYVSQNFVVGDPYPPTGDLLEPFTDGFSIDSGIIRLEAWATDQGSGIASARFIVNYDGIWREIGPAFSGPLMQYDWNLCNANIPIGPLSVALSLVDYANNRPGGLPGLRHGVQNTICVPPPPACSPTTNQVALYAGADYTGACVLLGSGEYPNNSTLLTLGSSGVVSLKIGTNLRATLFSAQEYLGRSETFLQNDPHLGDNRIGVGAIASLIIQSRNGTLVTPTLLWPPPGVSIAGNQSISLSWRDNGSQGEFDIQVFENSIEVAAGRVRATSWVPSSLPSGNYTWRVRARSGQLSSPWSNASPFNLQMSSTPPPEVTTPFTDSMSTSATGWTGVGGWQRVDDPGRARSPRYAWIYTSPPDGQSADASLTSPPLRLPETGSHSAWFYYRYHGGETNVHWDQRWIQLSVDGGPYQNVHQLFDDPQDTWLRSPAIDLSPYTGSSVRIRLFATTLDGEKNSGFSWSVDDFYVGPTHIYNCVDANEPNDAPAQAHPVALSGQINAMICAPGDVDYYKFQVTQPGTRIYSSVEAQSLGSQLDPFLFLLDGDGASVLTENDDRIFQKDPDSQLGYRFTRAGTYYLKVKAWNHPEAGGQDYTYTLRLGTDTTRPAISFTSPIHGAFQTPGGVVSVEANDTTSGVSRVRFWFHDNEWHLGQWLFLGEDVDGSDGWGVPFNTAALTERTGIAFYAQAEDWAGNVNGVAAWNVILDKTPPVTSLLPLSTSHNTTAIRLDWSAVDNLSGFGSFNLQMRQDNQTSWENLPSLSGSARSTWFIGELGRNYAFRLRGVDRAGNAENYPNNPEAQTQIFNCTNPDAWDTSSPNDNSYLNAAVLAPGAPPQARNFCIPGDEDWVKITLGQDIHYMIAALAGHPTTAVRLRFYRLEGSQLTLLAETETSQFGLTTLLRYSPDSQGIYYLQATHIDSRVAGNDVIYHLLAAPETGLYLPSIKK